MTIEAAAPRLVLRPARMHDASRLLRWRNDPGAVRFSQTGRGVAPAEHMQWLAARLRDPACRLWIAEHCGLAVGQVRIDLSEDTGLVSIAVDPAQRGRGFGYAMLLDAMKASAQLPGVNRLEATAHPANLASLRIFQRAGFQPMVQPLGGFVVLEWLVSPSDKHPH